MFSRVGCGLVGAAAAALVLSGCTVNGPDEPLPDSAPSAENAGASRPQELAVAGKADAELCSLLTPEQQAQLDVARPGPVRKDEQNEYPGCLWLGPPGERTGMDVSVLAVPAGLAEFQEQKLGSAFPETAASYTVAGGFPAEQSQNNEGLETHGCNVAVDVAEGQTLWVLSGPLVPGEVPNQQMCEHAKQAAEFAVATLRAQS